MTLPQENSGPGAGLVYLDNAATTFPKPPEVLQAVRACLEQSLTVARSTHAAPFRADEVLRRCRAKMARFIGARHPEEIVYTYSATDGLNLALNGLVRDGGHVIVSPLEHHSVMRPLHLLARTRGVSFSVMQGDEHGVVDPQELASLVSPQTCLVAINYVSNVSGTMQPVVEIGAEARRIGTPFLVDASQATGTHPVDVEAIGCDAMAQPAHKALFSLPGLGVLYLRDGVEAVPWRTGGTGQLSELVEQPEIRPLRYESGTPNVPAIVGLDAALDWLAGVTVGAIEQHCGALVGRLVAGLQGIEGVRVIGPPPELHRGALVSFTAQGPGGALDPTTIAEVLSEQFGISSRAGLHCAPTAHHHFGTYAGGGTVRLSFSYFNTPEQVDYALEAVREVIAELSALSQNHAL